MIRNIFYLLGLGAIVLLASCKPNISNPEVQNLYDEVMVIHDEVMPEISTIHKLKKKIRKLESDKTEKMDLIKELDDADESMMSWMSEFGVFKSMEKEPVEAKIKYLKSEKEKISKVSTLMKSSIAKAQEYLKEK